MLRTCCWLALLGFVGCAPAGPPLPDLYSVSGILTIADKPVPDVAVQLLPTDVNSGARPASGITGSDGKFTVSTNGKLGAAKGKYKVVLGVVDSKPMSHEDYKKISGDGVKSKGMPKPKLPFPEAWSRAVSSPLEHEVVDKATTLEIKI